MLKTLILCGGKGTRAYPHTEQLPKPLLEVDGVPILRHVMQIYAEQGFERFVLAAGYRADMIADYAADLPPSWEVEVVDHGEEASKGDRLLGCRQLLDRTFFVTYGDGVGDVDLLRLLDFHRSHGRAATVTVVPLPSQYGTIDITDDGRVDGFLEKPQLRDHWINAGFMVMEPSVFDGWSGDLETEMLPTLGSRCELYAYRHEGFWRSMDTYKDAQDLTALAHAAAQRGRTPWLRSPIGTP